MGRVCPLSLHARERDDIQAIARASRENMSLSGAVCGQSSETRGGVAAFFSPKGKAVWKGAR